MFTKEEIEQFYKDVENLGLKFPVAAIAEATGESKGNVSKYLNKKQPPSESFLKRFNEKFQKSSKMVSRETQPADITAKYIALLEEKAEVNSDDRSETLQVVLRHQKTILHFLGRVVSKVEKRDLQEVLNEINTFSIADVKDSARTGK